MLKHLLHLFWSKFLLKYTLMSIWDGKSWKREKEKYGWTIKEFIKIKWDILKKENQ